MKYSPNTLAISLTNRCELNCSFCSRDSRYDDGSELDHELVARTLVEARDLKIKRVEFTGGNAFLSKYLKPHLQYATDIGFESRGILSNCNIANPYMKFEELKSSGLNTLGLSIDCEHLSAIYRSKKDMVSANRIVKDSLKAATQLFPVVNVKSVWRDLKERKKNRFLLYSLVQELYDDLEIVKFENQGLEAILMNSRKNKILLEEIACNPLGRHKKSDREKLHYSQLGNCKLDLKTIY
ncbi:MAG: radical SAM protein, partial [Candidatus Aenigmarchaeota archaeon]|nr:radical SAM protein [Candidatus Aenigmarchaeota archaeon]